MINDQAYIARFTSTREKMPVSDGYFSMCGKVFVITGGDKGLGRHHSRTAHQTVDGGKARAKLCGKIAHWGKGGQIRVEQVNPSAGGLAAKAGKKRWSDGRWPGFPVENGPK